MKRKIVLIAVILCSGIIALGFAGYQQKQPETMPLIPMMQKLLVDLKTVDHGIFTEDYTMIAEGAKNIADHPTMTAEDKKIIKETLGQKMKQFVAFDMTVHHHADSMRLAALKKDMQKVLNHYRIVQQGCVDCHSDYRDQISKARKKQ